MVELTGWDGRPGCSRKWLLTDQAHRIACSELPQEVTDNLQNSQTLLRRDYNTKI